jgi:hypothetical protein
MKPFTQARRVVALFAFRLNRYYAGRKQANKHLHTYLRSCHHVPPRQRRLAIARFDALPAKNFSKDLMPYEDGSTPLASFPVDFVVRAVQKLRQSTKFAGINRADTNFEYVTRVT